MKRLAMWLLYLAITVMAAWALTEDIHGKLGYSALALPYEAKVVRYEDVPGSLKKRERPIVEISFPDGARVTFASGEYGRYRMFVVGEFVRVLKKEAGHFDSYEIDDLPHRYGSSVLFAGLFLLSGSLVVVDLRRWRRAKRASQSPQPMPLTRHG